MVATPKMLIGFAALALASINSVSAEGVNYGVQLKTDVLDMIRAKPQPKAVYEVKVLAPKTAHVHAANSTRRLEGLGDLSAITALGAELKTNINELPRAGELANKPWPASYWPSFRDGLNYRWKDGEASATEKYATAFGKNVNEFMSAVSHKSGVYSATHIDGYTPTPCTSKDQCGGEECAIRDGESSGYCIAHWWGICHAWAPAAIFEKEPRCPVKMGDITFNVLDIKGLITQLYDGLQSHTVYVGGRNNDPKEAPMDSFGRYESPLARDINAAELHLALTNLIPNQKSFVLDVAGDASIWNQPISAFNVQSVEQMTPEEAASKFFGAQGYPFNPSAQSIAHVQTSISWTIERDEHHGGDAPFTPDNMASATTAKTYEYILELDASGNIIGGEWVGDNKVDHPDFMWMQLAKVAPGSATNFGLEADHVFKLLEQSVACGGELPTESPTPTPTPSPAPSSGSGSSTGSGNGTNSTSTPTPKPSPNNSTQNQAGQFAQLPRKYVSVETKKGTTAEPGLEIPIKAPLTPVDIIVIEIPAPPKPVIKEPVVTIKPVVTPVTTPKASDSTVVVTKAPAPPAPTKGQNPAPTPAKGQSPAPGPKQAC